MSKKTKLKFTIYFGRVSWSIWSIYYFLHCISFKSVGLLKLCRTDYFVELILALKSPVNRCHIIFRDAGVSQKFNKSFVSVPSLAFHHWSPRTGIRDRAAYADKTIVVNLWRTLCRANFNRHITKSQTFEFQMKDEIALQLFARIIKQLYFKHTPNKLETHHTVIHLLIT